MKNKPNTLFKVKTRPMIGQRWYTADGIKVQLKAKGAEPGGLTFYKCETAAGEMIFRHPSELTVFIPKKRLSRRLKKKETLRLWVNEFNKVGRRYGYHIGDGPLDFDPWINYFDDGYTPREAILEDISYC